jgi:hypothetical protein
MGAEGGPPPSLPLPRAEHPLPCALLVFGTGRATPPYVFGMRVGAKGGPPPNSYCARHLCNLAHARFVATEVSLRKYFHVSQVLACCGFAVGNVILSYPITRENRLLCEALFLVAGRLKCKIMGSILCGGAAAGFSTLTIGEQGLIPGPKYIVPKGQAVHRSIRVAASRDTCAATRPAVKHTEVQNRVTCAYKRVW